MKRSTETTAPSTQEATSKKTASKKTAAKKATLSADVISALDALLSTALADHSIQNLVAWKSEVDKVAKDQKTAESYLATLSKENQKLFWSIPTKAKTVEAIIEELAPIEDRENQILTIGRGLGLHYYRVGAKCMTVKSELGHGFWMNLCEFLGLNINSSGRAMRIYRRWKDVRSAEKKLDGLPLREAEAGPDKPPKVLSMFEQVEAEFKKMLARKIAMATHNLNAAQIAPEDEAEVKELMQKMGDEKLLRIASAILYKRTLAEKGIDSNQGVSAHKSENTTDETAPNTPIETEGKEAE